MINIRLAKEYMASPIFCSDPENMGHIELIDLPISKELRERIYEWDQQYQNTFNENYPPDSGFSDLKAKQAHDEYGAILAKELQKELCCQYLIEYEI